MRKRLLLTLLLCCHTFLSFAQQTDKRLLALIQKEIDGFGGRIGIYVKNLKTGKIAAVNADTVFPTASIVKVPILLGVMDAIQKGRLHYDSTHIYRDSLLYAGEDILGSFKDGEKIALKKLIMLMLTTSDNTASLWLQKLAGTGTAINALLHQLGYSSTYVNSRTPERENYRTQYGWGQTTPREMAHIFEDIYRRKIFTPAICDRMLRCLGRNMWDVDEALSQIPPTIEVFSKNGCVNQSRNEILMVNAPDQPYIFSIFTKDNADQSWQHDNEAWVLTRKLSLLLWQYFEPEYNKKK